MVGVVSGSALAAHVSYPPRNVCEHHYRWWLAACVAACVIGNDAWRVAGVDAKATIRRRPLCAACYAVAVAEYERRAAAIDAELEKLG